MALLESVNAQSSCLLRALRYAGTACLAPNQNDSLQ